MAAPAYLKNRERNLPPITVSAVSPKREDTNLRSISPNQANLIRGFSPNTSREEEKRFSPRNAIGLKSVLP